MSVEIVVEVSVEEMDGLIERIETALQDGLSLEPDDVRLVLQILRHFAFMQERLEGNETIKQKYLKLLGLVSASETQKELFDRQPSKKRKRTSPKRSETQAKPPKTCHHAIQGLEKGQPCPECEKGKLYKHEPASFVRVVGQPPLSAEQHIMEQLRCNACGQLFTANLSQSVLDDGARGQKYGYSARAMMGLSKFFMGSPYFRQENLQKLLGRGITASTIYDQCAKLAEAATPVFETLKRLAANAEHFYLDDTGHRILNQEPIEKPNRRGQGSRLRSGIYTSGMIATLNCGHEAVLFQTNIGHAGEWIDEILSARDHDLPLPIIMSDALSCNKPSVVESIHSLCNSHARRKVVDVLRHFPEQGEYIISTYAVIWQNDKEASTQKLSPEQRQTYHAEHSLPVMETLKTWSESQLDQGIVEANGGLGKALQYFLKNYSGLTEFCRTPGAKIDNNRLEMTLKLIATSRKNSYFYKTLEGAKVGDVITSLIASCENNAINVFDYLVLIQRNWLAVSRSPERWLPWNYQQAVEQLDMKAA